MRFLCWPKLLLQQLQSINIEYSHMFGLLGIGFELIRGAGEQRRDEWRKVPRNVMRHRLRPPDAKVLHQRLVFDVRALYGGFATRFVAFGCNLELVLPDIEPARSADDVYQVAMLRYVLLADQLLAMQQNAMLFERLAAANIFRHGLFVRIILLGAAKSTVAPTTSESNAHRHEPRRETKRTRDEQIANNGPKINAIVSFKLMSVLHPGFPAQEAGARSPRGGQTAEGTRENRTGARSTITR